MKIYDTFREAVKMSYEDNGLFSKYRDTNGQVWIICNGELITKDID